MPLVITGIRPVNWKNSLSRDLAFLVHGARGGGDDRGVYPVNIANRIDNASAQFGTGTINRRITTHGPGIGFPSGLSPNAYRFGAGSQFYGKTAFSMLWQGTFDGALVDVSPTGELLANGNPDSDYNFLLRLERSAAAGGNQKYIFFPKNGADGAGTASISSTSTYARHRVDTVVATYNGATSRLYVNGNLETEASTTGSSSRAACHIWLNDGLARGHQVVCVAAALWDRTLTTAEVVRLGNQPLQQLLVAAPSLADLYVPAAGGGGGSAGFKPAWARNSNVMIGVG